MVLRHTIGARYFSNSSWCVLLIQDN